MARRLPTIRDVAAQAGVSVGTASKALNNQGRVSAETRSAVQRAAEALRFSPNALIRSLQKGHTGAVGLLTWPVRESATSSVDLALLTGVSHGLASVQTDMLLYARGPERDLTTVLLDGRVDGAILVPHELERVTLETLAAAGLPTVALYRSDVPKEVGLVRVDNESGVAQAVQYLRGLGHRRIAFYCPLIAPDFFERFEAYKQSIQQAGLLLDPLLMSHPENYTGPVTPTWEIWRALPEPPTAVIAGNDSLAMLWVDFLQQLATPEAKAFSVIGFDDAPIATMGIGLTTIRQPGVQVGELAAAFVTRLIQGAPAEECRQTLPVELVVRSTTRPVAR